MKKRMYYRKIILSLSFVAIVIILISLLFQLNSEIKSAQKEALLANQYRAEESARVIDEKIITALKVFALISQSDEVSDYQNSAEVNPQASLATQKMLSNYANLLPNIDTTYFIYNKYTGNLVSNLSVLSLRDFYDKYDFAEGSEIVEFINDNNFSFTERSKIFGTGEEVLFVSKNKATFGSNTTMMLIPKSSLTSHVVSSENLYNFAINISTERYEHSLSSEVSDIIHYSYESSADDIKYTDALLYMLLSTGILFAVSLILIMVFTQRIYAPVKKLVSQTDAYGDVVGITDEFEFIKLQIENVKRYAGNQLSNKNLLLKELLIGYHRENIADLMKQNEIALSDNEFYFLYIIGKKEYAHSDFLSEQLIRHTLINACKQCGIETDINVIEMPMNRFVVFIGNTLRKEMISAISGTILDTDENNIILSKISKLSTVSNRYKALLEATKTATITNKNTIITEEELSVDQSQSFVFSDSSKKLLLYNISKKNKNAYLQTVQSEIIDYLDANYNNKDEVFEVIAKTLSSMLPNLKLSGEIQDALLSVPALEELKNIIVVMFLDCYNIINEDNENNNTKHQLINYISENYDRDISLQDMADHFNLSSNYIGILFKEKTGETFKAYLNSYRIQMARQILLETPNVKIKDVSISVGFSNTNTFIRLFKEKEGVSPGQYQKSSI